MVGASALEGSYNPSNDLDVPAAPDIMNQSEMLTVENRGNLY